MSHANGLHARPVGGSTRGNSHRVRQVYTIGKSFTWWIVMAAYLATMAAILANVPQPVQLLNTMNDFTTTGVLMCMRAGTPASFSLPAIFPAATQAVIAQTTVASQGIVAGQPQVISAPGQGVPGDLSLYGTTSAAQVADAILSGACQGAALQTTEASYLLNNGDPTGKYCTLTASGPPTDANFAYVFAFTANTTQLPTAVFEAFNLAIETFQVSGTYFNQCQNPNLFNGRQPGGPCAAYLATQQLAAATNTVKPLGVTDLSGLFAVQAIGAVAAILITGIQVFIKWEVNHHHGRGCIGSDKGTDKIPGEEDEEEGSEKEEKEEKEKKRAPAAPTLDQMVKSPEFVAAVRSALYGPIRDAAQTPGLAPVVAPRATPPVASPVDSGTAFRREAPSVAPGVALGEGAAPFPQKHQRGQPRSWAVPPSA